MLLVSVSIAIRLSGHQVITVIIVLEMSDGKIIEWSKKGNEVFCIAEFEKTIQIMGKIDGDVSALKYGQMIKLTKCLLDDKHKFFFSLTNK